MTASLLQSERPVCADRAEIMHVRPSTSPLRFIDLFAGLGGFHAALERLGCECVFASEINPQLADVYFKNFGLAPAGDIRNAYTEVPSHDILCAGFPCQPFSKAGDQLGFDCPQWGDLFEFVLKILDQHKPEYLLIENVPNLMRHDGGRTWERIESRLQSSGYSVSSRKLSPLAFGVPQGRERAIIVGRYGGLGDFEWPLTPDTRGNPDLQAILDDDPEEARPLPTQYQAYLAAWQGLLDRLPKGTNLSAFPIWAAEFGATYPFEGKVPLARSLRSLAGTRGTFGKPLVGGKEKIKAALPPYSRIENGEFPKWKQDFIRQNRLFYREHQAAIDEWLPSIAHFPPSFQKLEWNWKTGPLEIEKALIQFRASGIRVRRPDVAPSLVALTTSQVPVIPSQKRYMTVRECARLQSMGDLAHFPNSATAAFKALGNAVNVTVIEEVAKRLLKQSAPELALSSSPKD